MTNTLEATTQIMSQQQILEHWQGHRKLTRRVIEAFPEDKLFTYSLAGMRPFSELAMEFIRMAGPGVKGIQSREWKKFNDDTKMPTTKAELLELWDETTEIINETFPKIEPERFQETDVAFGQWEGKIYWMLFYFIDNEIHHRGQGFVYLRSLGIEPPFFWER